MKKSEDKIQQECIFWFQKNVENGFIFHVPNGGHRSKREAAKFKSIGVRAGVPDLIVCLKNRIIFVELKTPEAYKRPNHNLSKIQKRVHKILTDLGLEVFVCCSVEQFQEVLHSIIHD